MPARKNIAALLSPPGGASEQSQLGFLDQKGRGPVDMLEYDEPPEGGFGLLLFDADERYCVGG
jgi:hypothetical protein